MKVLRVYDRPNVSAKDGKTYHNYQITVGIPTDYEGMTVFREAKIRIDARAIEQLIQSGQIQTFEDLKGKDVRAFRQAPIYLSDFEAQYKSVACDVIVINRQAV